MKGKGDSDMGNYGNKGIVRVSKGSMVMCPVRFMCRVEICFHACRHERKDSCGELRYADAHRLCPECR